MARVVITIHPTVSDERLLSVADAMQQVLDHIKLFAQQAMGDPHSRFEWKLEKASTNTPFTVVVVAEAVDPAVDISAAVKRVTSDVSQGLRSLMAREQPPRWMTQGSFAVAKKIFARNLNGIGKTDIDFDEGDIIAIKPEQAKVGIGALEALNIMAFEQELAPRATAKLNCSFVKNGFAPRLSMSELASLRVD